MTCAALVILAIKETALHVNEQRKGHFRPKDFTTLVGKVVTTTWTLLHLF